MGDRWREARILEAAIMKNLFLAYNNNAILSVHADFKRLNIAGLLNGFPNISQFSSKFAQYKASYYKFYFSYFNMSMHRVTTVYLLLTYI